MVDIIEITKAEDWPEEEDNDEEEDSDDDDEEDSDEDVEFISENGFVTLQNQVQGQMHDSQYPPYKFVFVNEPSDVPSFPTRNLPPPKKIPAHFFDNYQLLFEKIFGDDVFSGSTENGTKR